MFLSVDITTWLDLINVSVSWHHYTWLNLNFISVGWHHCILLQNDLRIILMSWLNIIVGFRNSPTLLDYIFLLDSETVILWIRAHSSWIYISIGFFRSIRHCVPKCVIPFWLLCLSNYTRSQLTLKIVKWKTTQKWRAHINVQLCKIGKCLLAWVAFKVYFSQVKYDVALFTIWNKLYCKFVVFILYVYSLF